MARNYSTADAVKILFEGTDTESVLDLHRRFPLFTHKAMLAIANGGKDLVEFAAGVPEYVTARKFERALTAVDEGGEPAEDDAAPFEEDAAEEEKPEPKKRGRKKAEPVKEAADEPEQDEEEAEDGGKYAGMNAMELFKECKKRGIKAAPKKPAKHYIELLEKDDAKSEADDDEDDDWDI